MNRTKTKIIVSLIFNSLLVLSELFALSEVFFRYLPGTEPFEWYYSLTYYTNLSNILLLIGTLSSLIQDILSLLGERTSEVSFILKYAGVITTAVTFTTVYIFVLWTKNPRYAVSVQGNMWLLLHTICPVLGFISFHFFDQKRDYPFGLCFYPYGLTWIYTLLVLCLFFLNQRIPYASDMGGSDKVTAGYIFLCGLVESSLTFLLALLGKGIFALQLRKDKQYQLTKNLTK